MLEGQYNCCLKKEFHGGINRKYGQMALRIDEQGNLTGNMFPPMFWLSASFSYGKTDGKNFSFTAHWGTPCQHFSMDVEGVVEGDVLTGKATCPMGEFELEGRRI